MHGTHPLLLCDLADATFLAPEFKTGMKDEDLLTARTKQLAKMPQDLLCAQKTLAQSRFKSKEAFEKVCLVFEKDKLPVRGIGSDPRCHPRKRSIYQLKNPKSIHGSI
jgi:hypothetical protein